MAKLTKEQYNKWNAQAKNGFQFDFRYFITHNEKILIKNISQDNGCIVQFKLWYFPEYETKTNDYGCSWNVKTGRQIPVMDIEKLIPGKVEGVYLVHTIKSGIKMGDPEKNMKYSTLCKISQTVNTDDELSKILI